MRSDDTGLLGQTRHTVFSLTIIVIVAFNLMVPMTASNASAADSLKTDFGIYAEAPLEPPSQSGAKITDPVFGARIFRVTEAADVPSYVHQ